MRMSRRIGIIKSNGTSAPVLPDLQYIWDTYNAVAVYSYNWVETRTDENYVLLSAGYYYADGYTFDESTGIYTLSSPTYANLSNDIYLGQNFVGKFVIKGNSTGSTLYYFPDDTYYGYDSGSSKYIIGAYYYIYTSESYVSNYTKGSATFGTVSSYDMGEYPIDYYIGGVWYVLRQNWYTWDVYNVIAGSGYTQSQSSISSRVLSANTFYYASAYTFNSVTGIYTLTSYTAEAISDSYTAQNLRNNYVILDSSSGSVMYFVSSIDYYSGGVKCYASMFTATETSTGSKGNIYYGSVSSYSSSAYPTNGKQNGYWYVKQT